MHRRAIVLLFLAACSEKAHEPAPARPKVVDNPAIAAPDAETRLRRIEENLAKLKSNDAATRFAGLTGIRMAASPELCDRVIPALVAALESDPERQNRAQAALVLAEYGESAAPAVPALVAWLGDPAMRGDAIRALPKLGKAARPAVPVLAKMLEDPDALVRQTAAMGLAGIGKHAAEAAPALLARLQRDDGEFVRAAAAEALGAMRAETARAALAAAAESDASVNVRSRAKAALKLLDATPK
jgi:hypothetical protein